MGIFGPKKTEEEKLKEVLEKFGLDIDNYSDKQITEENVRNIRDVASWIAGNKWIMAGMALSFGSGEKQAMLGFLSALVNQNWILIRQNEMILRELKGKK